MLEKSSLRLAVLGAASILVTTTAAGAYQIAPVPVQPKPAYTINTAGEALDSIADVDGDGRRDLIVGQGSQDRVELRSGANGALLGVMLGPPFSEFGHDVASTGDVDGDGLEDILIGAPSGGTAGQAYIYSSVTLVPLRIWGPSTVGGGGGGRYGTAVTRAGQINGTGPEEVLVTMPLYAPAGQSHVGLLEAVDVAAGTTVIHTIFGTAQYEEFGDSVANLGNVDADGINDFVVGATRFFGPTGIVCQPGNIPGIARVYSGVSLNFGPGAEVLLGSTVGSGPADTHGFAVGSAGDIDADGIGDLIVGAPDICPLTTPTTTTYRGSAIAGAGGGVVPAWQTLLTTVDPCLHYGWAVSGVGNIVGGNYDEYVVSAPNIFGSCGKKGRVFVHNGRNGNILWTLVLSAGTATFGYDVTELEVVGNTTYFAISDPNASRVYVYGI